MKTKTMKRVSLGAILCSVVAIALLSACGGGAGVWHEPNHNGNENKEDKSSTSIEQILTFKADRPVYCEYKGSGLFNLQIDGKKSKATFLEGMEVSANSEKRIQLKASSDTYSPSSPVGIDLTVSFRAVDIFERDPQFDNQPNPTKPIPTMVTITFQEKINGKVTKEESETIKLYKPDNNAEYIKKYKTEVVK